MSIQYPKDEKYSLRPVVVDEEQILEQARALLKNGAHYPDLTEKFGLSRDWFVRRLEPTKAQKRRDQINRNRWQMGKRGASTQRAETRQQRDVRVEAKAEQIADTRDYTQRFFGDPLPGRSALDRKKAAAEIPRKEPRTLAELLEANAPKRIINTTAGRVAGDGGEL
jgi:hypothetical protein